MQINILKLLKHIDNHVELVVLEELKEVPFQIKRVYYLYNTNPNTTRGHHAHKTLHQVLICVHGSCKVKLDDGKESCVISLSKPNEGLLISNLIWREMYDFSPDSVLLVLASDYYDESDYIRDYDEFLKYVNDET